MALEYGNKEVIRLTYDKEIKKLVIEFREEIVEDGIVVSKIPSRVVAREDEFDAMLPRLFPENEAVTLTAMENTAKTIAEEQKQAKIQAEKDAKNGTATGEN